MNYFVLTSKRYVKEWLPTHHLTFITDKNIEKFIHMSGFSFFVLKYYFQFLIWKLKVVFKYEKAAPTLQRRTGCVNKVYRHILVIEWGLYDKSMHEKGYSLKHTGLQEGLDWDRWRPENIDEYPLSHNDLKYPIHQLSLDRYILKDFYKNKPPIYPQTFFFNFYLFIPVRSVIHNDLLARVRVSDLKTPIEIDFPILFEFLLLKFTIFSMLLSSSKAHIYEFYSLGFIESIFIRFQSIFDKIIISLFKLFWISNTFNKPNSAALDKYLAHVGTFLFYSRNLDWINHATYVFSVFKSYFLKNFENVKFKALPAKFWFSLILLFEFFLIMFLVLFFELNASHIFAFLHFRSSFRFFVFFFLFFFSGFLFSFYLILWLLEVLIWYFLPNSSLFYRVYGPRLKMAAFLNKMLSLISESILKNFFNLIFLSLVIGYFISFGGSLIFQVFVCTIIVFYFIRFLNFLLNLVIITVKLSLIKLKLGNRKSYFLNSSNPQKAFLRKVSVDTYLFILLPFSIIGHLFFSFIFTTILLFCYFLRLFYPLLQEKNLQMPGTRYGMDYISSRFKVPFTAFGLSLYTHTRLKLDFSEQRSTEEILLTGDCSPEGCSYFQDSIKPRDLEHLYIYYLKSPGYSPNSFQKFLCDRNNRFFMIEYRDFDFLTQKYSSRSVTWFPSKLIYCVIILVTFFWWGLINLRFIIYYFFIKFYSFYYFLIFESTQRLNFSRESFFKQECEKEYLYYLYWLDSNVFFSRNANSFNKKLYKSTFTSNF